MAYRDQPFEARYATLGDIAENVYLQVTPLGNTTRYGFRRPKGLKFSMLPEVARHSPDFITPTHLVEVVGLGRDGILKSIKTTKYEALKVWSKIAKMTGLSRKTITVEYASISGRLTANTLCIFKMLVETRTGVCMG